MEDIRKAKTTTISSNGQLQNTCKASSFQVDLDSNMQTSSCNTNTTNIFGTNETHSPTIHNHHDHNHSLHHTENLFIILLSLSAHSFFDGLILGLQDTEKEMWAFLVVILIHHPIISFSVGNTSSNKFNNEENESSKRCASLIRYLLLTLIWALIIPFGILITIFNDHINKLAISVLMNIAVGSFMYITFIELIPEAINSIHLPYKLNIFFILVGFGIICLTEGLGA